MLYFVENMNLNDRWRLEDVTDEIEAQMTLFHSQVFGTKLVKVLGPFQSDLSAKATLHRSSTFCT